jgi:hypothetical protein
MYENGWIAWLVALGLVAFGLAHNHQTNKELSNINTTVKEKTSHGNGEWR